MVRKGEAERAGKGWELPKAASHAPAKAGVASRERGGERHCTKFLDTKMAGMASSVCNIRSERRGDTRRGRRQS